MSCKGEDHTALIKLTILVESIKQAISKSSTFWKYDGDPFSSLKRNQNSREVRIKYFVIHIFLTSW